MKKIFFTFLFIFFTYNLHSYPDEFYPLRVLITESQYIVIGLATTLPESENDFFHSIVEIKIHQVLKGDIDTSLIRFKFDCGYINPYSAYSQDSTLVLAFLNKDKQGNFYIYGLSDGLKNVAFDNISIYKRLIKDMLEITKIKNTEVRVEKIVDWLVECSKYEITRYDGVSEIASDLNQQRFNFYPGTPACFESNSDQKNKLKQILESIDTVKYYDLGIIDILLGFEDDFLSEWIIQKLEYKYYEMSFIQNELEERLKKANHSPKNKIQ